MPNKPRRKKMQRLPQGKRQAIPGQAASTVQPAAPVLGHQATVRPRAAGGAAGVATAPARVAAYSYVGKELLTISILAAVMLTVVIVLTLALR